MSYNPLIYNYCSYSYPPISKLLINFSPIRIHIKTHFLAILTFFLSN